MNHGSPEPLPGDETPVIAEASVSPLAGRSWTDADGTVWTRRGTDVRTSRVRRLLNRADVRVMLADDGDPDDVPRSDRDALWQRAKPYLSGAVRSPGDHTDFLVGEFRSAEGACLLMFEERC